MKSRSLTLVTVTLWIALTRCAGHLAHTVERARREQPNDRGDVLSTTVLAVGFVVLAGVILFAFRGKAETIVGNVCTNADPSTC